MIQLSRVSLSELLNNNLEKTHFVNVFVLRIGYYKTEINEVSKR